MTCIDKGEKTADTSTPTAPDSEASQQHLSHVGLDQWHQRHLLWYRAHLVFSGVNRHHVLRFLPPDTGQMQ